MANLNRVFLIGNLTRDPQQRFLPSGQGVVEFGVATNRRFTANGEKREETTFVDITAWGQQGDLIHRYLKKGQPIFIEGRLKFDRWETKEGESRSKLSVVLDRFEFLGTGGRRDEQGGGGGGQGPSRDEHLDPADFGIDPSSGGGGGGSANADVPF